MDANLETNTNCCSRRTTNRAISICKQVDSSVFIDCNRCVCTRATCCTNLTNTLCIFCARRSAIRTLSIISREFQRIVSICSISKIKLICKINVKLQCANIGVVSATISQRYNILVFNSCILVCQETESSTSIRCATSDCFTFLEVVDKICAVIGQQSDVNTIVMVNISSAVTRASQSKIVTINLINRAELIINQHNTTRNKTSGISNCQCSVTRSISSTLVNSSNSGRCRPCIR